MWCRSRFMLLKDAPLVLNSSSKRSGEPSCEEITTDPFDSLSAQKVRAETERVDPDEPCAETERVDPDEPFVVRSLFVLFLLPLLFLSVRRALSRA